MSWILAMARYVPGGRDLRPLIGAGGHSPTGVEGLAERALTGAYGATRARTESRGNPMAFVFTVARYEPAQVPKDDRLLLPLTRVQNGYASLGTRAGTRVHYVS